MHFALEPAHPSTLGYEREVAVIREWNRRSPERGHAERQSATPLSEWIVNAPSRSMIAARASTSRSTSAQLAPLGSTGSKSDSSLST